MKIQSKEVEIVSIDSLIPYSKNANRHSDAQIERLIELIKYQGFRDPVIAQKGTGVIVAGHGRIMAARKMGMTEIPVIFQEFESEEQLYAFMVSHNAIQEWSDLDLSQINIDIADFGPDLEMIHLGLKNFTVEPLDNTFDEPEPEQKNGGFVIEVRFPNDMEMMDIHDDLVSRGYIVKVKK